VGGNSFKCQGGKLIIMKDEGGRPVIMKGKGGRSVIINNIDSRLTVCRLKNYVQQLAQ
jgi:hypothetical protein